MNPIHRLDLTRFSINRARRRLFPLACAAALMLPVAPILGAGLTGHTYERQTNDGIGPKIANVTLVFVKENNSSAHKTISDASGHYSITLNPGRYYVRATHRIYEDDTSAPGFVVVGGGSPQTANFFLRKPVVTTVLILRHGEKSSVPGEPLNTHGEKRAKRLREVLLRAGVTAVYSTDTDRTRNTVKPLADLFGLPIQTYSDPAVLKSTVTAEHSGDVVLVAGHSNTVAALVNAFGAEVLTDDISDFDNLYVVSVSGSVAKCVNLQYAVDSSSAPPPEVPKNAGRGMTLLLVGPSAGSGAQEPQRLEHAARKAGVTAIFTSDGSDSLVTSLATALGLPSRNFEAAKMQAFADRLISNHRNGTVVVAGKKAELQELIRKLGGSPFPVIYDTDVDHLIMLTRFKADVVRVVPMRF